MSTDLLRRLVMEGLLTEAEIHAVIVRRALAGEPVPVALRALGLASSEAIESMLGRMGFVGALRLSPSTHARALPRGLMRALWVLPIGESPAGVVLAMVDPTDSHSLRETAWHLRKPLDPRVANLEGMRTVLLDADPPGAPTRTRPPSQAARPAVAPGRPPNLPPTMTPEERSQLVNLAGQPRSRRNTPLYGQTASTGSQRPRGAAALGSTNAANAPNKLGPAGAIGTGAPTTMRPPEPGPRRTRTSKMPAAPTLPREALYPLGELRSATSRDAVARVVTQAMLTAADRAAFFVVKRGVVQGWEGATVPTAKAPGLSREALHNLWIPVTSASVFRAAAEQQSASVYTLSDSTADSILAAALGQRPERIVLAPVQVRSHLVAFLYADTIADDVQAVARAEDLAAAAAEALERLIVTTRTRSP